MDNPVSTGIQVWIDRSELGQLVAALCSAVDRGDRDGIVRCYTDDSWDDHGSFKGSGREFAEFVCGPGSLDKMHHLLGSSLFDVQGDEAWGETYFAFHGAAGPVLVSGYGRYLDYFRKTDGKWRLTYRRVVPDQVPAGDDPAAYWRSRRDRLDPSYDGRRWPSETDRPD